MKLVLVRERCEGTVRHLALPRLQRQRTTQGQPLMAPKVELPVFDASQWACRGH